MNNKTIMRASAGVLVLVLAYFGATYFYKGDDTAATTDTNGIPPATKDETVPPVTNTVPEPVPTEPVSTTMYKDGTYSAEGSYTTPAGQDTVGVTLTLQNDMVTDATVTPQATNPTSKHIQEVFAGAFKPLVVGKKVADLSLSKVAGGSLTSQGFNDAVAAIKAQAIN